MYYSANGFGESGVPSYKRSLVHGAFDVAKVEVETQRDKRKKWFPSFQAFSWRTADNVFAVSAPCRQTDSCPA
jgi:hypothetical protein